MSTPVVDFVGTPRTGEAPLAVQFTDLSSGTVKSPNELNATFWADFTDGDTLYQTEQLLVTPVTADGQYVASALSKTPPPAGQNYSYFASSIVSAQVRYPVYKTGQTPSGRSVARFDPVLLQSGDADQGINSPIPPPPVTSNGRLPIDFAYTATAKTLVAVVRIPLNCPAGSPINSGWSNPCIIGDAAINRFGLGYYSLDATHVMLQNWGYDGTGSPNGVSATMVCPKDQFVIISARHNGVIQQIRVNGGDWGQVACGTTQGMDHGGPTLCVNYGASNGAADIAHAITFATALSDDDLVALENWLSSETGVVVPTLADSHSWTFGDGGSSTLANPLHTYTAIGTYDVSLTDVFGGVPYPKLKPGYVVVTGPPPAPPVTVLGVPHDRPVPVLQVARVVKATPTYS